MFFLDSLNGGAWPLLVGGVICLVDSVNGRDPSCPVGAVNCFLKTALRSWLRLSSWTFFGWLLLCRIPGFALGEILGNSRSVMLLNALGDTRTTMSVRTRRPMFRRTRLTTRTGKHRNHIDPIGTEYCNYWSRNEECLVGVAHQTVPITSLPFVHTARRCFR